MIIADTGERISSNLSRSQSFVLDEGSPLLPRSPTTNENPYQLLTQSHHNGPRTVSKANALSSNVFKCALAYTLASVFVFTELHDFYGTFTSKHQIATVSIYFHPARTVGAMIQACGYVLFALGYSVIVGILSMLAAYIIVDLDWFKWGYFFIVLIFCGLAFSILGYFKIKTGNPTFDTSCTVAIIFLVTIVIKEDNIQKGILSFDQLFTYLGLVLTGVCISAVICFCYKPVYAAEMINENLNSLMDDINNQATLILHKFVTGKSTWCKEFDKSKERIFAEMIAVQNNLGHARFELLATRQQEKYDVLEQIANSHRTMIRILGGMAHTCVVNAGLLKDTGDTQFSVGVLFHAFIHYLGPPMNSFATTMNEIMRSIPFDHDGQVGFNPIYRQSLKAALKLYSEAREHALEKVYSHRAFAVSSAKSTDVEAIVATCGSFSYLLEELGEEILHLLNLLIEYENSDDESSRLKLNLKFLLSLPGIPVFPQNFKPLKSSRPFSKVTEALYPKKQAKATSYRVRAWKILQKWHSNEIRFAFRVGFGALILSIPAFMDVTRPVFRKWKVEWALIIYLIMMNRDLGAMTTGITARLQGTVFGALVALTAWFICKSWLFLLPLGFVLSTCAFNFILKAGNRAAFARFSLIAYNLVCLSTYTKVDLGRTPGDMIDVVDFAFHRTVSVSAGVLWALLISTCIFPDSARRGFRRNLSSTWMRMGMVWKANPLATLPRKDKSKPAELQGMYGDEELQQEMIALKVRLKNASNEFRLKGTFDPSAFQRLVQATQIILNAYYSLGTLVSKEPTPSSKELELIEETKPEVIELCSTIFLYFYVACASLRMGFPAPQELPLPEQAIQRMLSKLQRHRRLIYENESQDGDLEDFVLFYSYILITLTVTDQLSAINEVLRECYGGLDSELFSYT